MQTKFMAIGRSLLLLILLGCTSATAFSQTAAQPDTASTAQSEAMLAWLKDLYEQGVSMQGDSIVINKEASRLVTDPQYRQTIYPATYTWEATRSLIQQQELKKALWYFINLYTINDQNKELVVRFLLAYDKFLKMDKALMGAFYTYSLTDPEIGKIENGHSEITAPHIMEKKLNAVKAMLFYLDKYKPKDRKDK